MARSESVIKPWAVGAQVAKGWKSIVISVIDERRLSVCWSVCQGPPETWREPECMSGFQSHPHVKVWNIPPGGIIIHLPLSVNRVSGGGSGDRNKANNPTRWSDNPHL